MRETDMLAQMRSELFVEDPYACYRDMLRHGHPVWDSERHRWLVANYSDVMLVLHDPRFSSARIGREAADSDDVYAALERRSARKMVVVDEPDHARLRSVVRQAFSAKALAPLEAPIRAAADALLDMADVEGPLDLISRYAAPLSLQAMMSFLDLPNRDGTQLARWCDASTNYFVGGNRSFASEAQAAMFAMDEYILPLLASGTQRSSRHIRTLLLEARNRHVIDEDELLANLQLFVSAGHGTSRNLIGNGLLALLRHPEQLDRVRTNPALLPITIEELLRYDSPVQRIGRIASEDVTIGERVIRRQDLVVCLIGAANHDPNRFQGPERLDVGREANPHLAFGSGSHRCLGLSLARIVGRVAIESLLRQYPKLCLSSENLAWSRETLSHRGLSSLLVTLR
jgi:pimeloyl-[acyl-carrier protein] synthase